MVLRVKNAASRLYPIGVSPDRQRSSRRAHAEGERGAGASESRAVFFLSFRRCASSKARGLAPGSRVT
jgi:hypothetical protein